MLYEFAMTPDLFDSNLLNTNDASEIILAEIFHGLAQFGLLANLHKGGLIRHVEERADSLSPTLKSKVINCLSVLNDRHRLVKHPKCTTGEPKTDDDWLNLALVSHDRIPFQAIILSQELINNSKHQCGEFVEFFGSLESSQWNDCRENTVIALTKSISDYRCNLAPVLRHAKSLALIDPWFNCQHSRFFDTISICSNLLGQRGHNRLPGRIDIHAEAKNQTSKNPDACLVDWERKLRSLVSNDKHRFRVFLWESKLGSESMHDRYILTDQCGLSISGGLDCRKHSHPNSTIWSLVANEDRLKLWADYDPSSSPFKLLAKTEICPNSIS